MVLALDATYSIDKHLSGVGVYSREILFGLASEHSEAGFLFCYRPHRFWRSFLCRLPENCRRCLLRDSRPPDAVLFHGLNQRLPAKPPRRAISTFHDLFVLTGEYSSPEFRRRFAEQARHAAEFSERIIAVSEFTARQVEEQLGVERSRIEVVHHGVRLPPAVPGDGERENMILHVGAIQKRKNLERLVRAFEQSPAGWRLVLAGSLGFGAGEILKRIEASRRRSDIAILGYVSGRQRDRLYARARIFAFPSLDEGFGMPVLEAMAWGAPVLTSRRSALPEVSGEAALLVDPTDDEAVTSALAKLTGDPDLRAKLSRLGRARAAAFPWEAAVKKTWAVYRSVLG